MRPQMTIFCELLTKKLEPGGYIIYVFKNLDDNTYLMCTRLPNWECSNIDIGDIGYVDYKEVIAGIDTWYNNSSKAFIKYNYTGIYFNNFIHKVEKPIKEIQMT